MNVILGPELEQRVRQKVERGDYESADALVQEAVQRFLQEEEQSREELQHAIQKGLDELERGEYTEYDEHTIGNLSKEVHERGMKKLASLQTGKRA